MKSFQQYLITEKFRKRHLDTALNGVDCGMEFEFSFTEDTVDDFLTNGVKPEDEDTTIEDYFYLLGDFIDELYNVYNDNILEFINEWKQALVDLLDNEPLDPGYPDEKKIRQKIKDSLKRGLPDSFSELETTIPPSPHAIILVA